VLSRGLTTEKRLRDKLIQGGHETDAIEAAISRCRDAGLINDERYACDYVESRVRRGHGPQRIRHDLLQRGIDRAHIDTALADITPDGLEDAALTAARRKFARVDLEAAPARAKAMRWLVGRGYSMSDASATITAVRLEQAAAADDTA
jgi:regulatory protein